MKCIFMTRKNMRVVKIGILLRRYHKYHCNEIHEYLNTFVITEERGVQRNRATTRNEKNADPDEPIL